MYLSKENGDFVKDVLNLPEETGWLSTSLTTSISLLPQN